MPWHCCQVCSLRVRCVVCVMCLLTLPEYDEESKMLFETSADIDVVPTFDAMRLKEDLLRGIYSYGA